jgi:hypothetical protein
MPSTQEPSDDVTEEEAAPVLRALRRAVNAKVGLNCSFTRRERTALAIAGEAQRLLLEEELQSLADAHADDLLIKGVLYRKHQPGMHEYASLCGRLSISRATYRLVGVRNGPTVVPLELQAGLVEGATPAMAYRIALGFAKGHSRGLAEDMSASHRTPPSRTKLERMAKRIGAAAREHTREIEAYLRQSERLPDGAAGLSIGLDRTAVPLEEQRAINQPPKTRRKKRTKPYQRKQPLPVDVNYHMAYVGTVSITDSDGDVLVVRRYAAAPSDGPDEVVRSMMADVRNALRRNAKLSVSIVQDGAPEMWNLIRPALEQQAGVTTWLEAIDRYHLDERLANVLRAIEPDPSARKAQLSKWNDNLDADDVTIDAIEERIQCEIEHRAEGDAGLAVLQANATFIANNKDRMRYVSLRKAALPVGSGATEGACRYVVGERAKRASRRWHSAGLIAALALRAVYCSERLPRFFRRLQALYTADIREADSAESRVAS